MEPLELITAKLVLGYLRSEKCKTTYKDFLKTSSKLRHIDYAKTKYMSTRLLGHSLKDVLVAFIEIFKIIEGRLETTNYYNEDNLKLSLPEQLLYFLDKVSSSRTSTPTIISTPHGSHIDYISPDHSDLEATPVHTLPGNVENEEIFEAKSPRRRKTSSRYEKCSPTPTICSTIEKNREHIFDTESLAKNLMKNTEFQEKIAQTINKVAERQYEERNPEEFDKAIKIAAEAAQADPIFEDLLQEIIGSSNLMQADKHLECSSSTNCKTKDAATTSMQQSYSKPDMFVENYVESQKLAVDSLNAATEPVQIRNEIPDGPIHVLQPIKTYDAYGNYIVSNGCGTTAPCLPNSVYINTMTGLLIPSITQAKPFVVLNKTNPIVTPTVLSEQDIMKMPIILKDQNVDQDEGKNQNREKGSKDSTKKFILPKPTLEIAAEASAEIKNFFRNYIPVTNESSNCNNEEASISKSEDVPTPAATISLPNKETIGSKKKLGLKKVIYPKVSRKSPKPSKKPIPTSSDVNRDIVNKKKKLPDIGNAVNNDNLDTVEILSSTEKLHTPAPSEIVKKPTPKSGSHVRNLDFSSPPKLNPRGKSSSPSDLKATPIKKAQAVKTLFNNPDAKAWDADLRAIIPEEEIEKEKPDPAPKKQPKPSANKKGRKKGNKSQPNTTTEQEGLLLEAALKTPVKKVENDEMNNKVETEDTKPNSQTKTILSPSKLNNASKTILEAKCGEGESSAKFVTPDMPKQNSNQPIKVNRNITPMLETPVKLQLPKTPGASTPIDIDISLTSTMTPFTKMLEANLDIKSMDINSIQTPNLPITPGFPPYTPNIDLVSPYSNRPTDYSTGSSYYQPSDNEQNKNLEAHLREIEKTCANVELNQSLTLNEHLQIFNKSVIGKKNLSLMKRDIESTNTSYNSNCSSDEEKSTVDWCDKGTNDTVIFKRKIETPKRIYSLRTRNATEKKSISKKKAKSPKKSVKAAKKSTKKSTLRGKKAQTAVPDKDPAQTEEVIKTILNASNANLETSDRYSVKKIPASPLTVTKELEKKRLRIVHSLKSPTEPKKPSGKFKIKPIAKVFTSKKTRKTESPRKRKRAKDLQKVLKDLITSDDSELDFSLELSEDEETPKKDNKLLKLDKLEITASDVEAQNLIEGLKERGIHLVQNKTPTKKYHDKETVVNTSTTQLETFDREAFDVKTFVDEDIKIVYDETNTYKKTSISTENVQKTAYIGKLYLESINKEIDVHLKFTEFHTLIDIPPDISSLNESKSKENKEPHVTEKCKEKLTEEIKRNTESDSKKVGSKTKEKQLPANRKYVQIPENAVHGPSTIAKLKSDNVELEFKDTDTNRKKLIKTTNDVEDPVRGIKKAVETTTGLSDQKRSKPKTKENQTTKNKKPKSPSANKCETKEGNAVSEMQQIAKAVSIISEEKKNKLKGKEKPTSESKKKEKPTSDSKKEKPTSDSKKEKPVSGIKTIMDTEGLSAKAKTTEISTGSKEKFKKTKESELKSEKQKRDSTSVEYNDSSMEVSSITSSTHRKGSDRKDSYPCLDRDEDDLMNFASTGKDVEEENRSNKSPSKKRRLSDEDLSENSCKKMLKTLDVDSFLNKIHADTRYGQRK